MKTNSSTSYPFLSNESEMSQLICAIDWSVHSLGPITGWSPSLKTALSIVLNAPLPMVLFWGPKLVYFHNDAYQQHVTTHTSHSPAIGQHGMTDWSAQPTYSKSLIDQVFTGGQAVWVNEQKLAAYESEQKIWTVSYSPVIDESGKSGGVLITYVETTEKSKAISQLSERQEQLEFALQASGLGTWVFDLQQKTVYWDTLCQELYGFSNSEQVDYDDVMAHIHPDDRQRVDQAVIWALDWQSAGNYDVKFRTIGEQDNRLRWLHCQGKSYFDDRHVAYRFAGTARDITDEVLMQESRETTEEQARLAVESAGAGTFFINLIDDSLIYSPTLAKIFTGDEDMQLTRSLLITYIYPQDRPIREKAYHQAAKTGKLFYEARTVWNDGSIHWLKVMGTYLVDRSGNPTRFAGIAQDITPEVEARLEQQQFTSLVEGSPEYMSIARLDGPLLYLNPYGAELLGIQRKDVKSKKLRDLFTDDDWEIVRDEQIPLTLAQKHWGGTHYYRHFETGERIPLDIKRFIIDDPATGQPYAIVATGRDLRPVLAARKVIEESEAALQKVNQRLEIALNAGRLGSYELDLLSGLMECTVQCKANYGLPADATFNFEDLLAVILPEDRHYVQQAVEQAIITNSVYNAEYRINWPDGSLHWIRASGQATYDEAGTPLKMVGITMDITVQRMAQQELERQVQERTQELSTANQELIRTNHELEQFAYIASHDLQEPLRKIQSFAGLLLENRYNDELFTTYLDKVNKSSQRMSALIKAVLNYSRLSKSDEHRGFVDLNKVVQLVLIDFELLIEEKGAIVRCANLPNVVGITLQLHQLLTNLLSNALKFSERNPVIDIQAEVLSPKAVAEQADLNPAGAYVHLLVKDNGIGFEPQYADRIFTIFQRLNNARSYSGTGIGLALCRKIVDNHKGVITVESELGKGATFHVYLPMAQSH